MTETTVTAAGSTSVTTTFVAVDGPSLATVVSHVIWPPAVAVAGATC